MAHPTFHAVLMGDLVGSTAAASRQALHDTFNAAVDAANRSYASDIVSPLTITLGDEFQGLLASLEAAFAVNRTLRMKLLLERVEARFVVGTARIDTEINREKAWNMMGQGLAEAREKLGDKKDSNCYRFSFPENRTLELLLDGVGRSLTQIETGWTETQLTYVAQVMSDSQESKSDIAKSLGVSDNSLYKVLRSAELRFYSKQIETIEAVLVLEDRRRAAEAAAQ